MVRKESALLAGLCPHLNIGKPKKSAIRKIGNPCRVCARSANIGSGKRAENSHPWRKTSSSSIKTTSR